MADLRAAGWIIRRIERYRARRPANAHGHCHFEPSCSRFAEEALRTRWLPIALLMSAWRVLRCNLFALGEVADPVRRRQLRPRPNAVPTAMATLAAAGILVLVGTEVVGAQNLDGGCAASANGRDPTTMTAKDPLVVHKGESVEVRGTVPPAIAQQSADQIDSLTVIKISIVKGLVEPSTEAHPGTGPQWGDSVEVDDYLKWGVGLYKVEGTASGTGWTCTGDGYVKLEDGSPLGKPVGRAAAALGAVGAAGAALAARPKAVPSGARGPTAAEVGADFRSDAEHLLGVDSPPVRDRPAEAVADGGCALLWLLIAFGLVGPYGTIAAVAGSASGGSARRRIWVRGHPILGFCSGVVAGLGLTVLAQQFALWPLTIQTAILFPVLIGVVGGLRAWRGRPFRVA